MLLADIETRSILAKLLDHIPTKPEAKEFLKETLAKPIVDRSPEYIILSRKAASEFPG